MLFKAKFIFFGGGGQNYETKFNLHWFITFQDIIEIEHSNCMMAGILLKEVY